MAIGNMHKKFDEDWTCKSEDMTADRQMYTHTDRQARSSQYSASLSGAEKRTNDQHVLCELLPNPAPLAVSTDFVAEGITIPA